LTSKCPGRVEELTPEYTLFPVEIVPQGIVNLGGVVKFFNEDSEAEGIGTRHVDVDL
jgi:hypothetical protein